MSGNEKNKKWFIVMAIVLVCFAFAGAARAGTGWLERQKLLVSDCVYFGVSVSISADFAIVGAPYDDDLSGSAYIFKWNGTNWVEQQKLIASEGAANSYFGCSVSISGDYAIVGADGNDAGTGSAYIFKRDGTSWVEQQKLTASDAAAED